MIYFDTLADKILPPQIFDDFEKEKGPIKIRLRHSASKFPPVLFVPGSFCGAWIWKGNFFEYFHEAGYDVAAMSFGGHGQRGWDLWQRGLKEFDEDLKMAISEFDTPPILVAHSLGGLVAQRVSQSVPLKAMALLSPIPLDGVVRSTVSLFNKSPISLFKLALVTLEPRFARMSKEPPIGIYSSSVTDEIRKEFSGRLQAESPLVLLESLFHHPNLEKPFSCPVHFWGAEGDHVIPAIEVQRTARELQSKVRIFPGMSHTFQSEPNWREVADDILSWLEGVRKVG